MRRPLLLAVALAVSHAAPFRSLAADTAPSKTVLFFTKSSGWEHDMISRKKGAPSPAEKRMATLATNNGRTLECSKDGRLFTPENLKRYGAIVFFTSAGLCARGTDGEPPMSPDGKRALLDYVAGGGGFVGIHSASDTFHTANESQKGPDRFVNHGDKADPYVRMLGGEFIRHGARQKARLGVADTTFPGLGKAAAGITLNEEWYSLKDFVPDIHVLLFQETTGMKGIDYARPPYPSTWIRRHGQGRVFYTALGHREDVWANPFFEALLTGGIGFALGDVKADTTPNLEKVCPGWAQNPAMKAPAK